MKPCVFVVDDEPAIVEILRDVLELHDFKVVGIGRPELVRDLASDVRPNLFLIDVMLAGTSGIELARRLREEGFADTPMVAMSASKVMMRLAADSGYFQDILDKPFELNELLDRVQTYAAAQTAR